MSTKTSTTGRITLQDYGTHGTTRGDDYRVRGISRDEATETWCAMTNIDVRYFKTVAGAARYLARYGYDAYGRRA